MVILKSDPELLEIVLALRAAGRLAGLLYGRQQKGYENRDDGDHHQQFDDRESTFASLHDSYRS